MNTKKTNHYSRREFIKISGISSVAMLCAPMIGSADTDRKQQVRFTENTVPVLKQCDVLVVGGGFAGVTAALNFANAGKKVVLVERRIYLGREVTAAYRPWLEEGAYANNVLKSCEEKGEKRSDGNRKLLRFDHVKKRLENLLFQKNVEIVYASSVVQAIQSGNELNGVVIGNKSGRQAILSKLVLDCTETASVVHSTKQKFQTKAHSNVYSRMVEYTNVKPLVQSSINTPSDLKIKGNKVIVHKGYLGDGHYYIECPFAFRNVKFDAKSVTEREAIAWEKSIKVAQYLYQNVPEFKDAYLTNSAYQLIGAYSPQMGDLKPSVEDEVLNKSLNDSAINLGLFATAYKNLFCINEAARLDKRQTEYILTAQGASEYADLLSDAIVAKWSVFAAKSSVKTFEEKEKSINSAVNGVKEKFSPQKGKNYKRVMIHGEDIPVLSETEVLIVGGGTSGAPAAYTAANAGKKTTIIDMNPGFGGTGTYGGVDSYWGPGGYYANVAEHIKKSEDMALSFSKRFPDNAYSSKYNRWSIQGKMAMWLDEIRKSGADIIWNSFAIGTLMDGKKAIGAVISTPQGIFAIKSKVVIDATGDGDLAAFAGASYVFGSKQNNVPLWYALRRQQKPGPTSSVFQSTVDVTNIEDYTRSVHVGLRTGKGEIHDHQPYLAPRESRHIVGDVVTNLNDNMTFREWEDTINIHRSNTDMKGWHTSDWFRIGLIPPNLSIEVPYRAIVPKGIENMLITGKAISTTHDSFPALRMQNDLENLGPITSLAAVEAIDSNVSVRNIDIKRFQKKLVKLGYLPQEILTRIVKNRDYNAKEIESLIKQFTPDVSLKSYANTNMSYIRYERIPFAEVCASSSEVAVPVLSKAYKESGGKMKQRIALALAFHGSDIGAKTIYDEIENQLKDKKLPLLLEEVAHSGHDMKPPPDQGAAPICANLIYALGLTCSPMIIHTVKRFAESFRTNDITDFRRKSKALFFYIDAVGFASSRIGSREVIPYLLKIHSNEFLSNRSLKKGIEKDFILERLSLMELILGRALSCCASPKGYEILIEYLDDMRAVLAGFAHETLITLSGKDFGKDKVKWNKWLASKNGKLSPVPILERYMG
jgi:flavin-dependent dehydrogenase